MPTGRIYFIADIGANHDGDLNRALMLIEKAAESGANAAKFQHYTAEGLISKKGFQGIQIGHQASWERSVYDTYDAAAINPDWTPLLAAKCAEVGIDFFTSCYSLEEVDQVDPFVTMYKIGSGDIDYKDLIKYIMTKNKPILIATGASNMKDVYRAMGWLSGHSKEVFLLQCNTNYTGSRENYRYINLRVLETYKKCFPGISLGLSDHTPDDVTVLGAICLGATVIEKHFTDDCSRPGNDHSFAIEPEEWKWMVQRANDLLHSLGNGIKRIEYNEKETSFLQRRGLRYTQDLEAGTILEESMIKAVRPAEGMPPYMIQFIVGQEIIHDVEKDDCIKEGDFFEKAEGK